MINSMTGFGAADAAAGEWRVAAEVRSVNHRFFTPSVKLPAPLAALEGEVRDRLKRRIARGHVTVAIRATRDVAGTIGIDEDRAAAYVSSLRSLRDRLGLAGDVDVATLLRLPDVITGRGDDDSAVPDGAMILAVLDSALDALDEMRGAEGAVIAGYLRERLSVVEGALGRLAARAPARVVEQHARLRDAVASLAAPAGVDPARLAQEIALLAERVDVAEELDRFAAHLAAFRAALDSPPPGGVGKRLGFLLQEMLRETNTTGSKAGDAAMLADVVLIKEELERLREQSENVE